MSVDSENKSNEAIAPFSPLADQENTENGNIQGTTNITPEMVLRLPTITDSKIIFFLFFLIYHSISKY